MKGYSEDLYILAFDHRGTITKGLLGVDGREPTQDEANKVSELKQIIFDGFLKANESGITGGDPAILVDDQFREKIKEIGADFVKILVRWNPDDEEEIRETQGNRIKELSDWLSENDKKFLLEFLVPATEEQLASVENDQARYDSEIRPKLAVKVVEEMRERGADPDIWKIEGLDTSEDCEKVAHAIRTGDREDVIAVVLGRGASDEKVNEWLRAGSSVEGYKGFAIGRSIFWDALKGFHEGEKSREEAVEEIAQSYLGFLSVYQNGG